MNSRNRNKSSTVQKSRPWFEQQPQHLHADTSVKTNTTTTANAAILPGT